MSNSNKVIGIAGLARSGKDTVAQYLVDSYGYTKYSFADPIKDFIIDLFDLDDERCRDGDLKEVELELGFSDYDCAQKLMEYFHTHPTHPVDELEAAKLTLIFRVELVAYFTRHNELCVSPRTLYQVFGTEVMRNNALETFWLDMLPEGMVVVPDIRFENEAEAIRKIGTVVHIERSNTLKVAEHASENGVFRLPDEYLIMNDGSIQGLYKAIDCVMKGP